MNSLGDGDPLQQSEDDSSTPSINIRKTRSPLRDDLANVSTTSLPIRPGSPATHASRAADYASPVSRSGSPNGRTSLSLSRFGRSSVASPLNTPSENYDELRSIVVRSFSPVVAIYAADNVDDLARRKGVRNGFAALIRPYGEKITGKVVVRDSVGASRAWDDFGIHLVELGRLAQQAAIAKPQNDLDRLEEILEQVLEGQQPDRSASEDDHNASPLYQQFVSRLLQAKTLSPQEAFLHPVGAVIAISSSTPQPIETLRHLYEQTRQGSKTLPPYVNPEYLRYYVLVHDEDSDDFAKSSALFDQMKRHFGLHCHLLRLKSAPSSTAQETEIIPTCTWLSPSEDLAQRTVNGNLIDVDSAETQHTIPTSDANAIRLFLRELVAQSIVPHMEQRIALWNEQIASRRRGISGRFMSISRRWAGIGGSARSTSSATNLTTGAGGGASGNYDSIQNYYHYDVPEALLGKLAAYAFMLRDFKLAASTFDLVRSDYSNDKAWKYAAGANEMCYVANLLNPLTGNASAKLKMDSYDQMIEVSSYSYLTRCGDPTLALRAILLASELLKVRGKAAAEMAAKWAVRSLELGLASGGTITHVLISERIAQCFAGEIGLGGSNSGWGTRKRKAGLWNVMAADEWMKLGHAEFAAHRLDEAMDLYADVKYGDALSGYRELDGFMQGLQLAVKMKLGQQQGRSGRGRGQSSTSEVMLQEVEDETIEDMSGAGGEQGVSSGNRTGHGRNLSVMSGSGMMNEGMMGPKSPVRLRADPLGVDDDFE